MSAAETLPCYAIRLYSRRWLRLTPGCERGTTGWRYLTWTADFAEAAKFGSREAADAFARASGVSGDYEIVS